MRCGRDAGVSKWEDEARTGRGRRKRLNKTAGQAGSVNLGSAALCCGGWMGRGLSNATRLGAGVSEVGGGGGWRRLA